MRIAFSLIVIVILSYSTGMLLEVVAEGDESKMLRLFNTGQVEPNWIPFGPVGTMYQGLGMIGSASLEYSKYPGLIGVGYLSDDQSPISEANIAFDIGLRVIDINGKKSFQNVVDKCIFHSPQSFSPLCVKCRLFDDTEPKGVLVGEGILFDFDETYTGSDTKEIEVISFPEVESGKPAANDVQDVSSVEVEICTPVTFLVIDEDSIDNGIPPNFFSSVDVNNQIADIGLRATLPAFSGANNGTIITLHTGEVSDEAWFALKTIPDSWNAAGPNSGLINYLLAEPGLGSEPDPEELLDKIPDVTPLRAEGLKLLEGRIICAVVYDSSISINYEPLTGSLKGDNLGIVAFKVISVTKLEGFSDSSLPKVEVEILEADKICAGGGALFTDAPVPESSSDPFDVDPDNPPSPLGTTIQGNSIDGTSPYKYEICHKGETITVSENALPAHLAHGDAEEECDDD